MIDVQLRFVSNFLSHACKTPPVEGAGAGSLPVPYPGCAKKKKRTLSTILYAAAGYLPPVDDLAMMIFYCGKCGVTTVHSASHSIRYLYYSCAHLVLLVTKLLTQLGTCTTTFTGTCSALGRAVTSILLSQSVCRSLANISAEQLPASQAGLCFRLPLPRRLCNDSPRKLLAVLIFDVLQPCRNSVSFDVLYRLKFKEHVCIVMYPVYNRYNLQQASDIIQSQPQKRISTHLAAAWLDMCCNRLI
jgi:hypothetical protein